MNEEPPKNIQIESVNLMRLLLACVGALIALGGVSFTMLKDRLDNQARQATADIATLREEIKATKSDAKDLVNIAAAAAKDAVANSATALRDSLELERKDRDPSQTTGTN